MSAALAWFVAGGLTGLLVASALHRGSDGDRIARSDIELIVASERREAYTEGMLAERDRAQREARRRGDQLEDPR